MLINATIGVDERHRAESDAAKVQCDRNGGPPPDRVRDEKRGGVAVGERPSPRTSSVLASSRWRFAGGAIARCWLCSRTVFFGHARGRRIAAQAPQNVFPRRPMTGRRPCLDRRHGLFLCSRQASSVHREEAARVRHGRMKGLTPSSGFLPYAALLSPRAGLGRRERPLLRRAAFASPPREHAGQQAVMTFPAEIEEWPTMTPSSCVGTGRDIGHRLLLEWRPHGVTCGHQSTRSSAAPKLPLAAAPKPKRKPSGPHRLARDPGRYSR